MERRHRLLHPEVRPRRIQIIIIRMPDQPRPRITPHPLHDARCCMIFMKPIGLHHRAMMEAYGLHKYHTATGVVQWMGSNAWPGLIWHTYDYYLYPAGTYFGMKKAMAPLHIMYSYAGKEVDVTNSLPERFTGLMLEAAVYDLDGRRRWSWKMAVEVGADSVWRSLKVPEINGLSSTYFLRLQLTDANGVVRDINWYWLSAKGDVLDFGKSKWYVTPEKGYADYSGLETLGKTVVKMEAGAGV